MKPLFIAVEGPIGIGKTTISTELAASFNAFLLKEIVEENPFLEKFYNDPEHWAFQTEIFFLCNRYKQLEKVEQVLEQDNIVISDYHIFKNLLFAKRTLNEKDFKKYEHLFKTLLDGLPKPDIVIYSNASIDTLLSRIKKRGRIIEKGIDPEYLKQLSMDYKESFSSINTFLPGTSVLEIDGDSVDFVANPEKMNDLSNELQALIKEHQSNPDKQHYRKFTGNKKS
ncbi:deoxynucleoside kinase [Bacillus toyonensis]|uniref:deoxynucleoside kinase n=1 Tax=Bacillus toyonensis TaxID=155322 RepID=UPI002E1F6887|nr:deoxynucleoside kinase [Bacillus toyonensis]